MKLAGAMRWSYMHRYKSLLALYAITAISVGCNLSRHPVALIEASTDLSGYMTRTYRVTIPRDGVLRVQLDQYGLDCQVGIDDRLGSTTTWYESGTGRYGIEIVSLAVRKASSVAITIKGAQRPEIAGRFALRVDLMSRNSDAEMAYSNGSRVSPLQARSLAAQTAVRMREFEDAAIAFIKDRRPHEAGLSYLAASEQSESGELDPVYRRNLADRASAILGIEKNSFALATALIASVAADLNIPNPTSAQLQAAIKKGSTAVEIFTTNQEFLGAGEAGLYVGELYFQMQKNDAAKLQWEDSEILCRQAKSNLCIAQATQNLGRLQRADGNYLSALSTFQKALSLFDRTDHVRHYAVINENIGYTSRLLGRHDSALRAHILALDAYREIGRCGDISGSLYAIGHSLQAVGSFHQAMQAYGLVLAAECGSDGEATIYSARPSTAAENREAMLSIDRLCASVGRIQSQPLSVRRNMLWTAWDMGNLARSNGNALGAIGCHKVAHSLAHTDNTRLGTQTELADDFVLKGDFARAKEAIDQVLANFTVPPEFEDPRNYYYSRALLVAGRVAGKSGDTQLARQYLGDALPRFGQEDRENRFECLRALGESSTNIDEAISYFRTANVLLTSIRASSVDLGFRASLFSNRRDLYVSWVDSLLKNGRGRSESLLTDSLALRTLVLSERSRARALTDLLADHENRMSKLTNEPSVDISSITQDLLATVADGSVGSAPISTVNMIALQRRSLDPIIESAENSVLEKSANTITQLQRTLSANSVVVQYLLGTKVSYVWVLTRQSIKVFELPPSIVIQHAIEELEKQSNASRMSDDFKLQLGQIYAFAIRPIEAEIADKDLFIVADQSLHRVPFAALWDSRRHRYLVERHVISMIPSIDLSARQIRNKSNRGDARKMLLVGDPVYDIEDRIRRCGSRVDQLPLSDRHVGSGRLTGSGREIRAIEGIAKAQKISPIVRTACAANTQRILSEPLNQFDYIHFATHATVDTDVPQRSAIRLSPFDELGRPVTLTISVNDLLNQKFSAELVVLSGCATAGGHVFGGEGSLSLSFALLAAGGQQVLSTLWPAADSTTEAMMREFYLQLLQNGHSASQSLRESQLALIKSDRWNSPRYWGNYLVTSLTIH